MYLTRSRTGSDPEPNPIQNRIQHVCQRIHKADIWMLTPLADNRTGSIMFVGVFIKRIFGQQRRWRRRVFASKYGSGYRVFAPEYGNGYVVGRQIDSIGSLSASVRRSCSLPGMPLWQKANFVSTKYKYRFLRQRRTRQRIFASGDPVRRSTTPAANKLLRGYIKWVKTSCTYFIVIYKQKKTFCLPTECLRSFDPFSIVPNNYYTECTRNLDPLLQNYVLYKMDQRTLQNRSRLLGHTVQLFTDKSSVFVRQQYRLSKYY